MIDVFGITILFLVIVIVSFLVFFVTKKMKKDAEAQYGNLRQALGADNWRVTSAGQSRSRSLYIKGTFMGRTVRCDCIKTMYGYMLTITSKPHTVPKKISWYKFVSNHPVIYKDYILSYKTISVTLTDISLSTERCNEILTDLNHACEMVESGNYELS